MAGKKERLEAVLPGVRSSGAVLACIMVILSLAYVEKVNSTIGEENIYTSAHNIKTEIQRRQEDINRIDGKIDDTKVSIDRFGESLSGAEEHCSVKLKKLRKLVILQDQLAKGNLIDLIASSKSIHETLMFLRTLKKVMHESISEYNDANSKKETLEIELNTLCRELGNLNEIKILLEKRQKELDNQLHTTSKSRLYI